MTSSSPFITWYFLDIGPEQLAHYVPKNDRFLGLWYICANKALIRLVLLEHVSPILVNVRSYVFFKEVEISFMYEEEVRVQTIREYAGTPRINYYHSRHVFILEEIKNFLFG